MKDNDVKEHLQQGPLPFCLLSTFRVLPHEVQLSIGSSMDAQESAHIDDLRHPLNGPIPDSHMSPTDHESLHVLSTPPSPVRSSISTDPDIPQPCLNDGIKHPSQNSVCLDASEEFTLETISSTTLDAAAEEPTIVDAAAQELTIVHEETCDVATPKQHKQEELAWEEGDGNCPSSVLEVEVQAEDSRRSSLKRSRSSYMDNTPSVQVIYKCLTSESKQKLKELMRQWAEWHGKRVGSTQEADVRSLESGDEVYFPALQVGGECNSAVPFWMDKPSKQARTETTVLEFTHGSQDREKEVPLYDRAGAGALVSQEMEISMDGSYELPEDVSRCFNCGSYSHSLKDCPRPRDNIAISNARKLLSEKRGSAGGSRTTSRYYQSSPGGKFDDLKPGILGSETRQSLGIGDLDPPPWLNRMRELGYPPGYLDEQEDEPSGITIFGTSDDTIYIGEDGEIIENGVAARKKSQSQKMMVSFPGVNAPIPDNADERLWSSPAGSSGYGHPGHRPSSRKTGFSSSYPTASMTSDVHKGSGDRSSVRVSPRHDSLVKSPKVWSPSLEDAGGISKGTPRHQNDLGRSGKGSSTGSPYLGKSFSDSGRKSPKVMYDDPRSLPPLAGQSVGSRQGNLMNSPRPYHSPHSGALNPSPKERLPYGQEYMEDMSEARRRAWAQAYDALGASHNNRYLPSRR